MNTNIYTHKMTSIAEDADVFRIFSPNPNLKYLNALGSNSNEFRQTSDVCGRYGSLYNSYKSTVRDIFPNSRYVGNWK